LAYNPFFKKSNEGKMFHYDPGGHHSLNYYMFALLSIKIRGRAVNGYLILYPG